MADLEQPLNLIQLARSGGGLPLAVPGRPLEVHAVPAGYAETPPGPLWLLLLSGELIVDLPFGDFRMLRPGDSLTVPAGTPLSYQPVEESVVLRRPGGLA